MDMIGFAGIPEAMSQGNLVAHLQVGFSGSFSADDEFVRSGEPSSFLERPGQAIDGLERGEEITVGRHHGDAHVGVAQLRRNGPCPGKTRDDLLVLFK